jgi:hypothetical protein
MNIFLSALVVLVMQAGPPVPAPAPAPPEPLHKRLPALYEMENFYYYDDTHKIKALPLQSKLFVFDSEKTKKWIAANGRDIVTQDKNFRIKNLNWHPALPISDLYIGTILTFKDNRTAMNAMSSLQSNKVPYFPIVKFDTMDCVPTYSLLVETKPAVTEQMLLKRLKDAYGFTYSKFQNVGGRAYVFWDVAPEGSNPSNIIALANLISEDTAWFKQARPLFLPLNDPVEVFSTIHNPERQNLGGERLYKITIKVYHQSVNVKMDLLPRLGMAGWYPSPIFGAPKDENWMDIGIPTITEKTVSGVKTIEVVTPFKMFHNADCVIPPSKIVYFVKDKEMAANIPSVKFGISGLIDGTDISDIQPMRGLPALPAVDVPPPVASFSNNMLYSGYVTAFVGLIFAVLCLLFILNSWLASAFTTSPERMAKMGALKELQAASLPLNRNMDDWRKVYIAINVALSKVLGAIYGDARPKDAEVVEDPILSNVLSELNKAYMQKATPDRVSLRSNLKKFVNQSYSNV